MNPDCRDGKHASCSGYGWDLETDSAMDCPCDCHECGPSDDLREAIFPVLEKCFDSDWNMTYAEMVSEAVRAAGYQKMATETEWGVRRDADSALHSRDAAERTIELQRKRKLKTFLIKRQVGPWELVVEP
ncbi:hypothetical protein [Pseudarthrobacter sp. ATCC 49987]|uniref:hypothetical protein n=1 Tax=Pseudarthrobacter sp. ATCC 49987 TaxID=2698204 RepID=UPI001370E80A|nr:hypothetical protein [Pseudarthrobacter sp. ATCC 49987]